MGERHGTCPECGRVTDLDRCENCEARICRRCTRENGCAICHGTERT